MSGILFADSTPHVRLSSNRQVRPALPRSVEVGWLVGYDHPHGGNGCRPTCNPSEALRRTLLSLLLFVVVVFAGALFRHANYYALWSCSRIEETRNEMHEEEREREIERGEFNSGGGTKGKHLC